MNKFFLSGWLSLLLILLPITAKGTTDLTPCTMIPLWSPQAQFAGYYVAIEKGIYQKHGIDVVMLKGGPDTSASEYLKDGLADFAVLWLTTAIRQYGQGLRLVHLGQVIPRSSMMLVAKKSKGIRIPADMNGKKIGLWEGDLAFPPRAFFAKYGLQVKEVPQSYTVNLFLRGGVDVASAMWYNEYHTILNTGINPDELDIFRLCDYDVDFPEDGLYMLETAYKNNPALAESFVRASFEGWQYAFIHPEEAINIVLGRMKAAKISANRTHQKWMLSRMKDLILQGGGVTTFQKIKKADYDAVSDFLFDSGLINSKTGYDDFTGKIHAEN